MEITGLNPSIFTASDLKIDFSAYDFEQDFIDWLIRNHTLASWFLSCLGQCQLIP